MITAAIVVLCCLLIGFIVGREWEHRLNKIRGAKEPKPVCGCKHHYALHGDDGSCHKMVAQGSKHVQCQCQRYTGPEPLPRMITGE